MIVKGRLFQFGSDESRGQVTLIVTLSSEDCAKFGEHVRDGAGELDNAIALVVADDLDHLPTP